MSALSENNLKIVWCDEAGLEETAAVLLVGTRPLFEHFFLCLCWLACQRAATVGATVLAPRESGDLRVHATSVVKRASRPFEVGRLGRWVVRW